MPRQASVPHDITDPLEPALTRGQVEWALWRLPQENAKRAPTTKFKLQVKHLLELDRSEPLPTRTASFAFSEEPAAGRGEHTLFSVFDAFLLEAGLSLLEVGFKRKDVVLFLRSRRDRWKRLAPVLRDRLRTAAPEVGHPRRWTDQYDEIILQIPAIDAPTSRAADHLFLATDFAEAFKAEYPRLIVLDMGVAGFHLPYLLLSAPLRRRGPS